MSTELLPVPPPPSRPGADIDETIRRAVRSLIKGHSLRVEDVAPAVGMNAATLYRRLAGKGRKQAFVGSEVAALAAYFGQDLQDLYAGRVTFGPESPAAIKTESPGDKRHYLRLIRGGIATSVTPVNRRRRHLQVA